MKRHKILEHTADVRLWVEAGSLEDLFGAALEGMSRLIKEHTGDGASIKLQFEIESPDKTSLLIDFLSEILTQSHNNKAVFTKVEFSAFTETKLTATISGIKTDGFDDDIKAVTYHEAEIKKNINGNFETMIVFDI